MTTQTIDSTDVNSSPTRRPGESPRQQSVCIEIPISVHGSRSASGGLNNAQAAKPFLEETRTMIVFPQGAVLRLTEPVSEGQILILKNARVKLEVACRVVSSKTNSSAKGYVEVEFFQPAPGFWGITFPAAMPAVARPETSPSAPAPSKPRVEPAAKPAFFQPPAPKPAAPVEPVIAKPAPAPEPVVPAAMTSQTPASILEPSVAPVSFAPVQAESPAPAAPVRVTPPLTPDSTQELNRAIAAAYAAPIESKPVKKAEPVQEAKPIEPEVVAPPPAPAPSIANVAPPAPTKSLNPTKPKNAPVVKPSREAAPVAEQPIAMADAIGYPAPQSAASVSTVKLNRASAQAASSAIETRKIELTPSQIASEAVMARPMFGSGSDSSSEQRSGGSKTWIIGVAAVVLLGLGAGTYWWTTIRKASVAKANSVSAVAPPTVPLAGSASATQPGTVPTGGASQPVTNPTSTQNSAAQKQPATPGGAASNSLLAKPDKNSSAVNSHRPNVLPAEKIAAPVAHSTNSSIAATPAPDVTTKSAIVPTGSLSSILPGIGQPSSVPAPPAPTRPSGPPPSASVLQQPKLIQTTSPIYPKIAATRGDWGDVVIDALVSESGKVTDTKVISGPDTLRQAALQVVRTQTYQPAKLNGKAVSMHVTVKIPFPKPR